jgi:nitrite reductase/ring-hydroxylating ferredoxin subunit
VEGARQRLRIVPVDEIPENGGVVAAAAGTEIGIFKSGGRLYAYENRCLHQGGPVCSGEILGKTEVELNERGEVLAERLSAEEIHLICPWHGWEYDITTGEVAHDRTKRLRRFEVTVEDGIVYVDA